MIETKKEVIKLITRCWHKMSHGDIPNDFPSFQKLLQDHEDAEYWHKWVGNQSLQEILDVWKEDRQMIEKIKECLKNVHFTDEGEVLIKQIEDIFEEKK